MKAIILVALALIAGATCFSEDEYQAAFTNWMQKYQKVYSAHEFPTRYAIFKDNMDYVEKWNSMNSETILGLNIFADLSNAEYRSTYLGTKVVPKPIGKVATVSTVNLPASVDWRNASAVTPIKNQGQCGSCWSFSTTGSLEGIHALSTGNLVSLSEQNLMDCSTSYGNEGCNGGLMDDAFQYVIANHGLDTEASYPYTAKEGTCKYKVANMGATMSSYTDVSRGSESALQVASTMQPISVAIDASHNSFQLYTSGVYYESACSTTNLDHGVLVIGYGTATSDFWLVKNSWGTDWGIEGYIWMSRNRNNNCGIATQASYPSVSSVATTTKNTTTTHKTTSATHSTAAHSVASSTQHSASSYTNGGFFDIPSPDGGRGYKPADAQAAKIVF